MIDLLESSDSPLHFELSLGSEGIGWIELRPKRGLSVPIPLQALHQLEDLLATVEGHAARGAIRAVVFTSSPPYPTLTGYDLDELLHFNDEEVVGWALEAQGVLRRLEQLPVPSIAAIQGEWFGGAAELALACSYRVASDASGSRLGFPQTRFGHLPAWGGTVRLPRLIGLSAALQYILTGQPIDVPEAEDTGLVDRALPREEFLDHVHRYVLRRLEQKRPGSHRRKPVRRRLLDDTAPGRRLLIAHAARRYLREPGQSTVAARAALSLISTTITLSIENAFAGEAEVAGRLILSPDAQTRVHSHRFVERARSRLPIGSADFEAGAVLGAGRTGSDLAHALANSGTFVRLKDQGRERVRQGVERAHERLVWERANAMISAGEARRRAERIEGVTGFGGFGTLDLVVAAPDATGRGAEELLLEVEPHVRDSCLLAFHDWTTSPTRVQRALRSPERVVGLAPSFPVDRFPLLEIIPGTLTSPEVVSTARRLARRLGMTAIVVSDETPSPGTRLLGAYLAEAARLLEEGAAVDQIDEAALQFGFDVGPMHRLDAIGARRVHRLLVALEARLGERMRPSQVLERIAHDATTLYRYRDGVPTGPNPSLPNRRPTPEEDAAEWIGRRLSLLLVNEAALILEDGAVGDPGDLEMISILALGFPKARGGILFHAQSAGVGTIVQSLTEEAVKSGPRYAPAGLLRDLASTGRGFFGPDTWRGAGQGGEPVLQ